MKFFKTCAIALAMSGMMFGTYGMEESTTDTQRDASVRTRGTFNSSTNEVVSNITGVVQAVLHVNVEGATIGKDNVINLYTEGGDITQTAERTIVFNVKNVGLKYGIIFSGKSGLSNEVYTSDDNKAYNWSVKRQGGDEKIGVNVLFRPEGADDDIEITDSKRVDFQEGWTSGNWEVEVVPQELTANTIIDTYSGTLNIKIEATD